VFFDDAQKRGEMVHGVPHAGIRDVPPGVGVQTGHGIPQVMGRTGESGNECACDRFQVGDLKGTVPERVHDVRPDGLSQLFAPGILLQSPEHAFQDRDHIAHENSWEREG
jgi:hypothetical protein